MANETLTKEIIQAVENYIANHGATANPTAAQQLDDLNLMKWTNKGHMLLDSETNKQLAIKVSDSLMAEKEANEAAAATASGNGTTSGATNATSTTANSTGGAANASPTGAENGVGNNAFAQNIRQQFAQKNTSSDNAESSSSQASSSEKTLDGSAQNSSSQNQGQNNATDSKEQASADNKIASNKNDSQKQEAPPPKIDPKATPFEKFQAQGDIFQNSYISGFPAYQIKNGVEPQVREIIANPQLSSAQVKEELRQFSKPLNEAKKMENTNPLAYNFMLLNAAWISYVDSLGHFAGTPPLDAAVNETYANLDDLNKQVNELHQLNQENPNLQQYPAKFNDTSPLDDPSSPWPDKIYAKDTTASEPTYGGGEGSPWPDKIYAKDTKASTPFIGGGGDFQADSITAKPTSSSPSVAKQPVDQATAQSVQQKAAVANDSMARMQASAEKVNKLDEENGYSASIEKQRIEAATLANEYNSAKRQGLPTDEAEKKIATFKGNLSGQMDQSKSGSLLNNISKSINDGLVTPAVLSGVAANLAFNQMVNNLAVSNNFDAQLLTANNPILQNSDLITDSQNKVITDVSAVQTQAKGQFDETQAKGQGVIDDVGNKVNTGISDAQTKVQGQFDDIQAKSDELQGKGQEFADDLQKQGQEKVDEAKSKLEKLDPRKLAEDKLGLQGLDPDSVSTAVQNKIPYSQDDLAKIAQQQKAAKLFNQASNYSVASTLLPLSASLNSINPQQIQYPPEVIDFTEKLTKLKNSGDELNSFVGDQSNAVGDKIANNEQLNGLVDDVNNSYAEADQSLDALIAKRNDMIAQSPLNNAQNLEKLNFAASNLDALKNNPTFGALCGAASLGSLAAFEMPQLASMINMSAPDILNPLSGISLPSMPSFSGGLPSMPSMPSFSNGLSLQMMKLPDFGSMMPSISGGFPNPLDGLSGLSMMDTGALSGAMNGLSMFSMPTLSSMMSGISLPAMPQVNADMGALKDKFASLGSTDGLVDTSALTGPLFAMRDMALSCPLLLLPIIDFQFALTELSVEVELDNPEPETPEVGAQQYACSEAGMLQCMMGISPAPYMIPPSGETFTPGFTMGATLIPTLFPTHGGCNIQSNPTAAAQLFIPPYQCVANLHAPFVPGNPQCMVMHGASPILIMNDMCTCLYSAGGQIMVQMPGQFSASKG